MYFEGTNAWSRMANGVKRQRTAKRDDSYSQLHRGLGRKALALDIDMIEYKGTIPVAIIESKHDNEQVTSFQDEALSNLAALANLPYFVIRHNKELTFFDIEPRNLTAKTFVPQNTRMDRVAFIYFQYKLRGTSPTTTEINAFVNFPSTTGA